LDCAKSLRYCCAPSILSCKHVRCRNSESRLLTRRRQTANLRCVRSSKATAPADVTSAEFLVSFLFRASGSSQGTKKAAFTSLLSLSILLVTRLVDQRGNIKRKMVASHFSCRSLRLLRNEAVTSFGQNRTAKYESRIAPSGHRHAPSFKLLHPCCCTEILLELPISTARHSCQQRVPGQTALEPPTLIEENLGVARIILGRRQRYADVLSHLDL
jgi:hypothetical protein